MRARRHPTLFETDTPLPAGFRYEREFLGRAEEAQLLARLADLTFGQFRMRGVVARRRTVQFRWHYSFETFALTPAAEPPDYLAELQARAEAFAGTSPGALDEILVTEYSPGATIGWHRDAPPFDVIVGISLGASCRLRLLRKARAGWETRALELAPRSIYMLDGPARRDWQHSIPAVRALRYSVTFRSLRTTR